MADYRNSWTRIWEDEWFYNLTPEGKVLWHWCYSNSRANMAGIYMVAERMVPVETALPADTCKRLFKQFEADGKLMYHDGVMWVTNLRRYQALNEKSDSTKKSINKDLSYIKPGRVLTAYKRRYGYPIDTLSDTADTLSTGCAQGVDTYLYDTDTDTEDDTIRYDTCVGNSANDPATEERPYDPFESTPQPSSPRNGKAYSDDFEAVWKDWPDKQGKKEAYIEWQKLKKSGILPDVETLRASIAQHKAGRKWQEGYILAMRRWLKGEHWQDEVAPYTGGNNNGGLGRPLYNFEQAQNYATETGADDDAGGDGTGAFFDDVFAEEA